MSFTNIKGQQKAIDILKGYIAQSRLAGGYLFTGTEGIGKKLVAQTLAKAINCLEESLDSCDRCPSCVKIDKNQHPDFHLVDTTEISDAIKIEYVRQLQKDINLRPYEARYKVFIIDNAENLTPEAANATLKILEEPPQNSLIILISSRPQLLFKTIISRCQVLKFYSLKRTQLKEILKNDYSLEDNLAHFLAYFSEGRIGKALRWKDSDILREKNRIIDTFVFSRRAGFEDQPTQNREEVRACLNILASWFRDVYLIKVGIPHSELINIDRRNDLLGFMNRYSFLDLEEIMRSISDSFLYLGQNVNVKLLLSNLRINLWKT